ncbi:MAG: hypothetical protein ACK4M7_03825, partial [Burkholderiales bacterium]
LVQLVRQKDSLHFFLKSKKRAAIKGLELILASDTLEKDPKILDKLLEKPRYFKTLSTRQQHALVAQAINCQNTALVGKLLMLGSNTIRFQENRGLNYLVERREYAQLESLIKKKHIRSQLKGKLLEELYVVAEQGKDIKTASLLYLIDQGKNLWWFFKRKMRQAENYITLKVTILYRSNEELQQLIQQKNPFSTLPKTDLKKLLGIAKRAAEFYLSEQPSKQAEQALSKLAILTLMQHHNTSPTHDKIAQTCTQLALKIAVKKGNITQIKALMQADLPKAYLEELLSLALKKFDLDTAIALKSGIKSKFKPSEAIKEEVIETEILTLLLKSMTPKKLLSLAITQHHNALIQSLVKHKLPLLLKEHERLWVWAAEHGNSEAGKEVIKTLLQFTNSHSPKALYIAAKLGYSDAVELILGDETLHASIDGALDAAICHNKVKVVRILINHISKNTAQFKQLMNRYAKQLSPEMDEVFTRALDRISLRETTRNHFSLGQKKYLDQWLDAQKQGNPQASNYDLELCLQTAILHKDNVVSQHLLNNPEVNPALDNNRALRIALGSQMQDIAIRLLANEQVLKACNKQFVRDFLIIATHKQYHQIIKTFLVNRQVQHLITPTLYENLFKNACQAGATYLAALFYVASRCPELLTVDKFSAPFEAGDLLNRIQQEAHKDFDEIISEAIDHNAYFLIRAVFDKHLTQLSDVTINKLFEWVVLQQNEFMMIQLLNCRTIEWQRITKLLCEAAETGDLQLFALLCTDKRLINKSIKTETNEGYEGKETAFLQAVTKGDTDIVRKWLTLE